MRKIILTTVFAASSLLSQGAAIHTGLINYWALDGNGSDTAGSVSGNNSTVADNLTAGGTVGAATFIGSGGRFGGAADFERTVGTNGRLAAANSADVNFNGKSLTISLWSKFENDDVNWQSLISKGEGAAYRVAIEAAGPDTTNNSPGYAGGTADAFQQLGPNVQNGNWHHIVATTTNGGGTAIYVNGAFVASQAGPATINDVTNAFSGELWIGNNPGNAGSSVRMWDGLIDDVAQWNRVLSPTEIQTIYVAGNAGFALAQVPEPSTGILGVLAGLLLIARRRR